MIKSKTKISIFPLFLHFCARILFCQVFLISNFILSQTPFSYSDSIIYIADDAYLYADQQTIVVIEDQEEEKFPNSNHPVYHQSKILPSSGAAAAIARTVAKSNQPSRFTAPEDSQQLSNTGSFSSQAVLGTSLLKLQQKAIPSSFILFAGARRDQEKHIHNTFSPFQLKHITINHFGRPPPILNHKA